MMARKTGTGAGIGRWPGARVGDRLGYMGACEFSCAGAVVFAVHFSPTQKDGAYGTPVRDSLVHGLVNALTGKGGRQVIVTLHPCTYQRVLAPQGTRGRLLGVHGPRAA